MLRGAAIALAAVIALSQPAAAAEKENAKREPQPIPYGQPRLLARLANQKVKESSGLACSRRSKDVFWTHNDSGDKPRIYAFNKKGEDLGTFDIVGANARDWEDMASFRLGTKSYLLLADVGDNNAKKRNCTLYLVEEPKLPVKKKKAPAAGKVRARRVIRFKYEDGPRNCEAVAIDAKSRTIYLVSKTATPACKVYALAIPKKGEKAEAPAVAKAIATLKIPTTTAMDLSPDGSRCAVLTYGPAFEFTRKPGETWKSAFSRKPRQINMPRRPQGESICYGADGKTLYLTSEGLPTPLWEVPAAQEAKGKNKETPNSERRKDTAQ